MSLFCPKNSSISAEKSLFFLQDSKCPRLYTFVMRFFLFSILFLICFPAWGQRDLCDLLDLPRCSGVTKLVRRSSNQSYPSSTTAAQTNPATISQDKGLGAEVLFQPNNPLVVNVVTGGGKVGGALISSSLENSFFGNRLPEIKEEFLERSEDDKRYKSKKLNVGVSVALVKKRNFTLDVGLIGKRHSEIKDINLGGGLSSRIGPLSLGGSVYRDDFLLKFKDLVDVNTGIPYAITYGAETYQEKFTVQNYSAGLRIGQLSVDAGIIRTKYKLYDDDTQITLLTASYTYRNFLFNFGSRKEDSPDAKFIDDKLFNERTKKDIYAGVQMGLNKLVIVGLNYNYFLLRELSVFGTVFF